MRERPAPRGLRSSSDRGFRALPTLTAIALAVLTPLAEPRAQEAAPLPETAPREAATADPAEGIHPDAVSSFQVREYRLRGKKLFKGLLQILEQTGYPPEEIDSKEMRVKTSFVDFKSRDYSEGVADPAPRLSPNYHILQMNQVKEGKVSIEGVVTGGEEGAVVSLRARILVQGLDQAKRIQVMVDRRSSGVIESDFLRKLEDTLDLRRIVK